MIAIPLTRNKFALIDDCDYWLVQPFTWYAFKSGKQWYAATKFQRPSHETALLHRLLAGFPPFQLDHKNGNGLDCRRRNLRPATPSQNGANRTKQRNNKSGYKGVYKDARRKEWYAAIRSGGFGYYLGSFSNPIAASGAYHMAANLCFGEFARI